MRVGVGFSGRAGPIARSRAGLASLVLAASLGLGAPARAQTAPGPSAATREANKDAAKETARGLMDEADRLVEDKRYAEALPKYERAHALMRVPTTGIEVARTLAAMGRSVEAVEAAVAVQRLPRAEPEPKAFAAARKEAEELAARLSLRVPTVQIDLAPDLDASRVRVDIDEQPVPPELTLAPRAVNPGRHTLRVTSPGRVQKTFTVDAKEGSRTRLRVVLEEGGEGGGLPPLAIAGLAVAGVGLVVGTVTGIVSLGHASDARTACGPDTNNCAPTARDPIRAAETTGWVSTISFVLALGGGGLAAHALLSRSSAPPPAAGTTASAAPVGLGASFGGRF